MPVTHASLGDIRLFEADHDPITGNPTQIRKTRDDNARQGTNFTYDSFGLVLTRKDVWSTGTNFDTLFTIFDADPVTLQVKSMTDTNGTAWGTSFDGFGREVRSTITRPDGTGGELSSTSYAGFELLDVDGDGVPDPTTRSITHKVVTDAVADIDAAPGRIGISYMDGFGRTTKTETRLGSDYQDQTLVVGQRIYDRLGRVKFEANPFLSTDSFETQYGTSYSYNTDGTPSCFVRGRGVQPSTAAVDEINEIYPTCFNRFFANGREILDRQDPDSLLSGSNQSGVVSRAVLDAAGRVLERASVMFGTAAQIDDVVFSYDLLGNRTSMTRYRNPLGHTAASTTHTIRWGA
jgi:hypothetical protein